MPPPPLLTRLRRTWEHDIWAARLSREPTVRNRWFSFLRIVSISLSGLQELKVAARAAALSYSSLLGLGPLIAIGVLIAGLTLGDRDPVVAARGVSKVISFVLPQVGQYQQAVADSAAAAPDSSHGAIRPSGDTVLVRIIDDFIKSSRSGTAGVLGIAALLVIVVLLFTSVEKTFNDIWGVRRGRNWLTRIVYYWAVMTVGAVIFFTALTLFSAGNFSRAILQQLPFRQELAPVYALAFRSASVVLLIVILTLFYRLIPNTRVKWTAAFIGAVIVTGLLFLNNYLAFLYFQNVSSTNRLYGTVAMLPVLMLGLYVFWLFILVGGQITYAVQNVHYRSSQTAWHSLSHATREDMSLLVLLLIARRFKVGADPCSVTELSHLIRVPSQILNESLNRLCDLTLITELPAGDGAVPSDHRYHPARPLGEMTLADFRRQFEQYGESPSGGLLENVDPVLAHYHQRLAAALPAAIGDQTFDQLIDAFTPSRTYAPFPAD